MSSHRITVHVSPNAGRDEIVGWQGERLKIKINAPAAEGKANDKLVRFLAKFLSIHRREIRIERGSASRIKVIAFDSLDETTLAKKLNYPSDQP